MEYRVTSGSLTAASSSSARDRTSAPPTRSASSRPDRHPVDYTADIRLTGWMRLAAPFAGGAFEKIGKDAAAGMQQSLEDRAKAAGR